MNPSELNEDQLWQLRKFIQSRGIKEPDVINEILDHFACKVEEIINQEPMMPFERVMQIAHQSFGKSGFRPLIAQYEQHLTTVMYQIFKQEIKNVLSSTKVLFLFSFGLIIVPILNFLGRKIGNHWFFDLEIISLLFIVMVSSFYSAIMFNKLKWKTKDQNGKKHIPYMWQQQTLSIPKMQFWGIFLVMPFLHKLLYPKLFMVFISIFMVLTLIRILAQYQTYLAMEKKFGTHSLT